jgi:hypothetical protein
VPRRPIPLPTSSRKVVQGAIVLALAALENDKVREQLRRAPGAAREWAVTRRAESGADDGLADRLDPTRRFGHKGLERRLRALERNVALVFPEAATMDAASPGGTTRATTTGSPKADAVDDGVVIHRAVVELQNATAISATMPLNERRRARRRIAAELGRLEAALVDAVLPADGGDPR